MVLEILLLVCVAILAYAWFGYPLILYLLTRRRSSPATSTAAPAGYEWPDVEVLIAAHNEAGSIGQRLDNILGTAYAGRIQIHVGDDASTDSTADIVRRAAQSHPQIIFQRFERRRGKAAVLRDLVGMTRDQILVFTDANTVFDSLSIKRLVARFQEKEVGGVCGRLIFRTPEGGTEESGYWNVESRLKEWESSLDSCLGANGAIYAIRRELFWSQLPDNTIVDDLVIGMKVREQGSRIVYEPGAVAEEDLPDLIHEWKRRVRIGAGDFQALWLCRRCLLPRFGAFAWIFWSHKVLRWFTPHILLLIAVVSACLASTDVEPGATAGKICIAGLLIFLAIAAIGSLMPAKGSRLCGPFRICSHFVAMQAALFVGFIRFCGGGLKGHWDRTPRGRSS